MARTRRSVASRFVKKFQNEKETYELAAEQARQLITEILENVPALVHVISGRCKDSSSLWLKLCEKSYWQPARQVTDITGVRVITYYRDEANLVVKALTNSLEVNPTKSTNKREELEAVEFGYTSVHLIVRTKGSWSTSPRYWALRQRWFEIQIRSILEHAWAEIEHEVVYKSGINFPAIIKRRFARMAGAIEMLEEEFVDLRNHQQVLMEDYKSRYAQGLDDGVKLDSVRLRALLECERPNSLGWRSAAQQGRPFPAHVDNRCVQALKRVGVRTGKALRTLLKSKSLVSTEALFAQESRLSEPPSHLATARLAVLVRSPTIFADFFPELMTDPTVFKLYERRKARPK